MLSADPAPVFPRALSDYPNAADSSLWHALTSRASLEPFNLIATSIFILAIVHTFAAPVVMDWSHRLQARANDAARQAGRPPSPSIAAGLLHFFGEIEVVFGLWAIVLLAVMTRYVGWAATERYFNTTVTYTEPLFVVVVMALAATRPIMTLAERVLRSIAGSVGGSVAAWWATILIVGPLLGSLITEPAAMTISALLLGRLFFARGPGTTLKYATLGLLFVNISIGGTLTNFAAPPVLMVSHAWNWDTAYMLRHFGDRAVVAIILSTLCYFVWFWRELHALQVPAADPPPTPTSAPASIPPWITLTNLLFLGWTVFNAHSPVLFVGAFLFFLGFAQATAMHQSDLELKTPLLVGFFLAGLVVHGGLQGWWIQPVLARLSETPLFAGAALLTAFNDNALITYLGTLVPNLGDSLRHALLEGAVVAGGLTVIANAPNPAGQALLSRYFDGAVHPLKLLAAAAIPTLIAAAAFRLI